MKVHTVYCGAVCEPLYTQRRLVDDIYFSVHDVLQDEEAFAHDMASYPVQRRPTGAPSFADRKEVRFPTTHNCRDWCNLPVFEKECCAHLLAVPA